MDAGGGGEVKILDISVNVDASLPVWSGDPAVKIEGAASIKNGDSYNLSYLHISAHTGTHIDAPLHFLEDGGSIGSIALERMIGPVQVVAIPAGTFRINAAMIEKLPIQKGVERILFKTSNSALWGKGNLFYEDYTALDVSGAKKLVDLGIQLVGIDYLSISIFEDTIQPHILLLSKGIVILEGCDLSNVPPGTYNLICLPLKVNAIEGAPVRAILIQDE
jgi:arylformamidase